MRSNYQSSVKICKHRLGRALLYVLDTYEDDAEVDTYISWISSEKKQKLYAPVLSRYQEMNFVTPSQPGYKIKMRYKSALVSLWASEEDAAWLVKGSWYDLQDIIESWETNGLDQTLSFWGEKAWNLSDFDLSILKGGLEYIPEWLREEFSESFNSLEDVLNIDISSISTINEESIGNALDSAEWKIQDLLEQNFWWALRQFSQ